MLLDATTHGRLFTVKYLLQSGDVDVNGTDKHGQTALIKACLLEDKIAVTRANLTRLLLSKGANVNNVDLLGRTVLIWACFLGKVDVVEIILRRCVVDLDFNIVDLEGNTALHYAANNGDTHLVTILVEPMVRFGICLDTRNNKGLTPLLEAVKHGNGGCAGVLMANGASANIVDPETLLNAKELAKSAHLVPDRMPRDPPRSPREPDEGDPHDTTSEFLEIKPRRYLSKSVESLGARCENPKALDNRFGNGSPAKSRGYLSSVLLPKRKERRRMSLDETGVKSVRAFSEMTKRKHASVKKTRKIGFLDLSVQDLNKTPKSRSDLLACTESPPDQKCTQARAMYVSGCSETPTTGINQNGVPRSALVTTTEVMKNPYDLRDFKSVLSLYGEQTLPTLRTGFPTAVMTPEQFQDCLKAMSPEEPVLPDLRVCSRMSTCSSASSVVTGPSTQSLRLSVLRGQDKRRRSPTVHGSTASFTLDRQESLKKINRAAVAPLNRNFTEPTLKVRLPVVEGP